MKYIANVSGGLASVEAWRRCLTQYPDDTVAVFADVRGSNELAMWQSPALGEDLDLYRFLWQVAYLLDSPIERLIEGRNIWQVFQAHHVLTQVSPKGVFAPCSLELKRELVRDWIDCNFGLDNAVIVLGLGWDEADRIKGAEFLWQPAQVWCPLAEPPIVDNCHITAWLNNNGIEVPGLYLDGAPHNNCGGGCVKAGQAHWYWLLITRPEVYAYWEQREQVFRLAISNFVHTPEGYMGGTILKDRRGGKTRPMSLKEFRERIEAGEYKYDRHDWGGCGCFSDAPRQVDMFRLETGWLSLELAA